MKSRARQMRLSLLHARRNSRSTRPRLFRKHWKFQMNRRTRIFTWSISRFVQKATGSSPRLIELQAFPSLFGFQLLLLGCIRKAYPVIPRQWTSSFGGIKDERILICYAGQSSPNRILRTLSCWTSNRKNKRPAIDFAATEKLLGIRSVCVTKIRKRERQLFYERDGREVRIERIYNRVIFDELIRRPDLNLSFQFQDDLMSRGSVTRIGISGSASIRCRF